MDEPDREWSVAELPAAVRAIGRSEDLVVRGGGLLVGADLTGIEAKQTHFLLDDSLGGLLRGLLPTRLVMKPGREIAVFEDCDFSGMRGWFEPGVSRFYRCRFLDVRVSGSLMQAHFVDCQFSGRWDANFGTESGREDPARQVAVTGNDFRDLRGMDFFGVPEGVNQLDTAGDHLVLRRVHLADPQVRRELSSLDGGWRYIERLEKAGHEWVLLERGTALPDNEWELLRDVVPRD